MRVVAAVRVKSNASDGWPTLAQGLHGWGGRDYDWRKLDAVKRALRHDAPGLSIAVEALDGDQFLLGGSTPGVSAAVTSLEATTSTRPLEDALTYLRRALPVFPVCGLATHTRPDNEGKQQLCTDPGKVPLVRWRACQDRLPTEDELRSCWRRWPDANIGMPTGHLSGIVGDPAIRLAQAHGYDNGLHVFTGRVGGQHRYSAWRADAPRNFARTDGIDFRSEGGYVILPPSRHRLVPSYTWGEELRDELPELPEWLNAMAVAGDQRRRANGARSAGNEDVFGEGELNNRLASIAGAMRRQGADEHAILAALLVINECQCRPSLSESEVCKIAHSVAGYEPQPNLRITRTMPPLLPCSATRGRRRSSRRAAPWRHPPRARTTAAQ
jgi:hypothetical protein